MYRNPKRLTLLLAILFGGAIAAQTPGQSPKREPLQLRIVSLEHCPPTEAVRVLSEVYPNPNLRVSPLSSTNQIVLRGSDEDLKFALQLIERLEQEATAQMQRMFAKSGTQTPPGLPPSTTATFSLNPSPERRSKSDPEILQQASVLRDKLKRHGDDHQGVIEQRKKLEELVRAEFDRRLQLHQQRWDQLQQKLKRLAKRIEEQSENQEQIIQKRIDQLIHDSQAETQAPPATTGEVKAPPAGLLTTPDSVSYPQTELATALSLVEKMVEARQRITNAEFDIQFRAAELERAEAHLARAEGATAEERDRFVADIESKKSRLAATKAEIDTATKMLDLLRLQADTQRRLLENSVEQATVALDQAETELARVAQLYENKLTTRSELDKHQAARQHARLRLERAKTILEAFQQSSN